MRGETRALRDRYEAAVTGLREFEPRRRVAPFPIVDFDQADYFTLLPLVPDGEALVEHLEAELHRCLDDAEARRKAALSAVERLSEEVEALRSEIHPMKLRIAALEARIRPDHPEIGQRREPDLMVMAMAPQSGPLTSFNATRGPARSGVRRIG